MNDLYETMLYKDSCKANHAETHINLNDDYVLTLHTRKANNKSALIITASVSKVNGLFLTHKLYDDFYIVIDEIRITRATMATIEKNHILALGGIDTIINQAKKTYNIN
jgi:hypothetical protein